MKRTKTFLTLSLAGLIAVGLTACSRERERGMAPQAEREGEPTAPATPGDQTGGTTMGREGAAALTGADRDFLTQQIHGNMAEIELARLAEQRASNEQVRDYAEQLREDHERASEQLRNMANQYQVTVPTEMDPKNQQTMERMRGLSGQQFDRQFLQHQVQAHQQKIQQYQQISQQSTHPDLKNFASSELSKLQNHLQRAQELQRGGTGADRSVGTGAGSMGGTTNQPRY